MNTTLPTFLKPRRGLAVLVPLLIMLLAACARVP